MPQTKHLKDRIFQINDDNDFNDIAIELFHFQFENNLVYRTFVQGLSKNPMEISHYRDIPFLPIGFFKSHRVISGDYQPEITFLSSGTTGRTTSKHHIKYQNIYVESFKKAFDIFFGTPEEYIILALLPSYLEHDGSSLVFMVDSFIKISGQRESGFYLHEYETLHALLMRLKSNGKKVILFGVSFALLDLADQFPIDFPDLIIIETGGMKGRRKELIREELHQILKKGFGVEKIYSEYGMTELLSQAYSKGEGLFASPPWMKVLIRDTNDPFSILSAGKTGGINVIDLANIYSCSFIATQDLGKIHKDGRFEVLGRFDSSDVRGCNLMVV